MGPLTSRDFARVLDVLRDCYALRSLDEFPQYVIRRLSRLVPADIVTYNEVNPRARRSTWIWFPDTSVPDSLKQAFDHHMRQHPLITYHARRADGRTLKISDFLSRHRFHDLGLYREFFRHYDVEDQIALALPAPPPIVIGIAFNRHARNFSEPERWMLELLRPHVTQSYLNAEAFSRVERRLRALDQALEESGEGVITLAPDLSIRVINARARHWIAHYFDWRSSKRLPEPLARWVRSHHVFFGPRDTVPPPRAPLVVERDGRRLVVRLLDDPGEAMLILKERATVVEPSALESLDLTRREAEVLAWVARGKTNAEIAATLGTRPRTITKHLERIFPKLGVATRTAAAAVATQTATETG